MIEDGLQRISYMNKIKGFQLMFHAYYVCHTTFHIDRLCEMHNSCLKQLIKMYVFLKNNSGKMKESLTKQATELTKKF